MNTCYVSDGSSASDGNSSARACTNCHPLLMKLSTYCCENASYHCFIYQACIRYYASVILSMTYGICTVV